MNCAGRGGWVTMPYLIAVAVVAALLLRGAATGMTSSYVPRESTFKNPKETNNEEPVHAGLFSTGLLFEVLVRSDGSWTTFLAFPDGMSCPAAPCGSWHSAPEGKDDPAA